MFVIMTAVALSHACAVPYDVIGGIGQLDWDSDLDGIADGWECGGTGNTTWTATLTPRGVPDTGLAQTATIRASVGQIGTVGIWTSIDMDEGNDIHEGDVLHVSVYLRANLSRGVFVAAGIGQETADWQPISGQKLMPDIHASVYDWTKYETDITIAPGAAHLLIQFYMFASLDRSFGKLSVDDLKITKDVAEIPTPPPGVIPAAIFGPPGDDVIYAAKRFRVYEGGQYTPADYRTFREYSPNSILLVYEAACMVWNADYVINVDDPVAYSWINTHHPEWFLVDQNGERMRLNDHLFLMDPGNPHYQQAWAEGAIRIARRLGADGVKFDGIGSDAMPNMPAKYPDIDSYVAAVDSFMRHVAPAIRRAGLLVMVNATTETWTSGPWSEWIQLVDGFQYEPPLSVPEYESEDLWRGILDSYRMYPNKLYMQFVPSPKVNRTYFQFGLASFLLWARPNSYMSLPPSSTGPAMDPLMDIEIGSPLGETEEITDSVYTRDYENGRVYLNISATASEWVQIPPGLRNADTGELVAEGPRLLAPHEPLILLQA